MADSRPDAVHAAGSRILSAVICHGYAHDAEGKHTKFCNFPGGCMGYDDILAKGIDGALERQGAEKYKGHHGSHREAGGVEFFDLFSGRCV